MCRLLSHIFKLKLQFWTKNTWKIAYNFVRIVDYSFLNQHDEQWSWRKPPHIYPQWLHKKAFYISWWEWELTSKNHGWFDSLTQKPVYGHDSVLRWDHLKIIIMAWHTMQVEKTNMQKKNKISNTWGLLYLLYNISIKTLQFLSINSRALACFYFIFVLVFPNDEILAS